MENVQAHPPWLISSSDFFFFEFFTLLKDMSLHILVLNRIIQADLKKLNRDAEPEHLQFRQLKHINEEKVKKWT